MSQIDEVILICAMEIRGLREAVEKLTDRISEAAGLWQPSSDHSPARYVEPAKANKLDDEAHCR